ncbi:general stress protein [Halobacillus sp. A5]|uniref:general stress protein n=1 Tax=Halobacillus sp. A5 TaxID=2880263 RepID=UPI0020A64A8C|nr:general stress protein [Halobacillus sp. A5]
MKPKFKVFHDDEHLSESIENIRKDGVNDDDIYILAHDNDHVRHSKRNGSWYSDKKHFQRKR